MKIVVTIIGQDQVGIVAKISATLAAQNVNILDINQNIMNGFFNMVLIADMEKAPLSLTELQKVLSAKGEEIGVEVKVQHEDIFKVMHRV